MNEFWINSNYTEEAVTSDKDEFWLKLRRYSDYWCPRLIGWRNVTSRSGYHHVHPRLVSLVKNVVAERGGLWLWSSQLDYQCEFQNWPLKILTVSSTPSPRCHNSWSPICRPHVEGHLLRSPNVLSLLLSLSHAAGTTAGNWGTNLKGSQWSSKIIFSFSDYFLVEDLPLS